MQQKEVDKTFVDWFCSTCNTPVVRIGRNNYFKLLKAQIIKIKEKLILYVIAKRETYVNKARIIY